MNGTMTTNMTHDGTSQSAAQLFRTGTKDPALHITNATFSLSPNSKNALYAINAITTHTMIPRGSEDADLIDLTYGSKVVLRCSNNKYVMFDEQNKTLHANSSSPVHFVLINGKNVHDRGAVRFQDVRNNH